MITTQALASSLRMSSVGGLVALLVALNNCEPALASTSKAQGHALMEASTHANFTSGDAEARRLAHKAVLFLRKAVEEEPNDPEAVILLSSAYEATRQDREQGLLLAKALRHFPMNAGIALVAGLYLARHGELELARHELALLRKLDPIKARSLEAFIRVQRQ